VKDLLKKTGIIPYVAGLVLLTVVSYLLIFSPKIKEIRRLQAEVAARETEMGSAIRLWSDMVRMPGQETRRWEQQVREWREKVPETPETERLMEEIGRRAVLHNLKGFRLVVPEEGKAQIAGPFDPPGLVSSAAPADTTEKERAKVFDELHVRLSFFSSYKDMAEFVDGIPRMKRLLSVRSLTVGEKDGEMQTTLDLSAYYGKPK
jgi:Tfp pilus assembly protein PilO